MGVAMVAMSACHLREILQVGKLTALGSAGEVARQLDELARSGEVALRLGRLRRALQVRGNLPGYLHLLRWVRFLKLLQNPGQLRKWRKFAVSDWDGDATLPALPVELAVIPALWSAVASTCCREELKRLPMALVLMDHLSAAAKQV